MQTRFTPEQLADGGTATAESIIRKCVHCGFCTATCPTYALLGDENDSPRGRIYMIKEMLETEAQPSAELVKHVDRCLSCLACMTTCPSDVNYMHLVDHARAYIEARYRRPWRERWWRWVLARVLPNPGRMRFAIRIAALGRPFAGLLGREAKAMLALAPNRLPSAQSVDQPSAAKGRVILLKGCAEPVLAPQIRAAATRLLNRMGYAVIEVEQEGCCGALVHHLGRADEAKIAARRNVAAWSAQDDVAAILTTASGCGTMLKDYGFLLGTKDAEHVSARVQDISEFVDAQGLPPTVVKALPAVAYHAAGSLQHGQRITAPPRRLLATAGFAVREIGEGHLCCGSAGTYNILQPEIAEQLRDRKLGNILATGASVVTAGNIGCLTQISRDGEITAVHLVELLDWATGGPKPADLAAAM